MPYLIIERDNQFCVYQQDADHQPVGDALGCHATQPEAEAQMSALYANEDKATTAIKTLNDSGRVGGYLVVWGSPAQRDLQGEYFTRETDLALHWYDRRPALYHHGLDGSLKAETIGVIDFLKEDDVGLWAEAQLDMRNRYIQAVQKLIKQGVLAWSSGSLPHLVEVDKGKIKRWPIVEGSMTPSPAEPRHTDIHTIKSAYESLGLSHNLQLEVLPTVPPTDSPAKEPLAIEPATPAADGDLSTEDELPMEETFTMNLQEIIAAVIAAVVQSGVNLSEEQQQQIAQQVMAAMQQETPAEEGMATLTPEQANNLVPVVAKAVGAKVAEIQAQRAAVADAAKTHIGTTIATTAPASKASGFSAPQGQPPAPNIQLRTAYADLSAEDMSYYIMLRNAVRRRQGLTPWQPNSPFIRELMEKAGKAYERGELRFGDTEETNTALKAINFYKANELDHSTQANFGDEWVPDLWSSQIWERTRLDNVILPLFQNIEMPSNPFELPIESTDPTVLNVPETTAETELLLSGSGAVIPDSKVGTGKVTLTARKMALRVGFSTELEEDSIIPFTSQLRKQALRAMEDALDNVAINGDTDTSANTNINLIDGTPAATAKYLNQNGILKLSLITTTANAINQGGTAPTLTAIRSARFSMGGNYATRPDDIAYIVDVSTYAKLLNLPEFLTRDVIGDQATTMTGMVGKIDGSPVLVTTEMALANAAGKIPNAGGTLGRLAVVYRPGWYVGYRRRVNVVVDYLAYYDSYQLTATVRFAFINRDGEVAASVYNIAV